MRLSFSVLLVALLWTGQGLAQPRIGDPAPALGLSDLRGQPVRMPRGQVVIVDFFATWCGPCHEAIAALTRIVQAADVKGRVTLLIVDSEEAPARVRAYFAQHPLPAGAQVLLDQDGAAGRAWGRTRFPTTFLVDGGGVVRHINRGYGPGYEARVGRWLRGLLDPP